MMEGVHWVIRTDEQERNLIRYIRAQPKPYQAQIKEPSSPKTLKQIRYAHSLCNALAAFKQCSPETAKRDSKREFGVIIVCTSIITGERTARLKSFADYSKGEMEAFIGQMTAYLDENEIPYTPSEG